MSSIGKRLRYSIESKQLNFKEVSKMTGISYRALMEYLADQRMPGGDALIKISAKLSISVDWLLTGEGQMSRQPAQAANEEQPAQTGSLQLSKPEEKLIETIRMLTPDRQKEVIEETQKNAERSKQILDMQEKMKEIERVIRKSA